MRVGIVPSSDTCRSPGYHVPGPAKMSPATFSNSSRSGSAPSRACALESASSDAAATATPAFRPHHHPGQLPHHPHRAPVHKQCQPEYEVHRQPRRKHPLTLLPCLGHVDDLLQPAREHSRQHADRDPVLQPALTVPGPLAYPGVYAGWRVLRGIYLNGPEGRGRRRSHWSRAERARTSSCSCEWRPICVFIRLRRCFIGMLSDAEPSNANEIIGEDVSSVTGVSPGILAPIRDRRSRRPAGTPGNSRRLFGLLATI